MDPSKLSDVFSMSTLMIHDATTELYESLHDSSGNPVESVDEVVELCRSYKSRMLNEIQMVVDICLEYNEHRGK